MSFVGLLYIFSKHDKFMYILSTIDGKVIEQTFHVSRLKQGLLRLPNGKSVRNINDYKLEMIRLCNNTLFNQKHVQLITYKLLLKMFTVMTVFISLMTQILLISGVNRLQFSR